MIYNRLAAEASTSLKRVIFINGQKNLRSNLTTLPTIRLIHYQKQQYRLCHSNVPKNWPAELENKIQKWVKTLESEQLAVNSNQRKFRKLRRAVLPVTNFTAHTLTLSLENITSTDRHFIGKDIGNRPRDVRLTIFGLKGYARGQEPSLNGRTDRAKSQNFIYLTFKDENSSEVHTKLCWDQNRSIQGLKAKLTFNEREDPTSKFWRGRHVEWNLSKFPGWPLILHTYKHEQLPAFSPDPGLPEETRRRFNEYQCRAISAALNLERPIVAIHGPAGTGKTFIIPEIVKLLLKDDKKILIGAATTFTLDLLRDVCQEFTRKFCLLYDMDGPHPNNFKNLMVRHRDFAEVQKLYERQNQFLNDPNLYDNSKRKYGEQIECEKDRIGQKILGQSKLLFCQSTRIDVRMDHFAPDVAIIEEGAYNPECMILQTILKAKKLIIIGDNKQNKTTLRSDLWEEDTRISLIERYQRDFGPEVNFPLRVQCRSNPAIHEWSNRVVYSPDTRSIPDASVMDKKLSDLFHLPAVLNHPLLFVDTDLAEKNARFPASFFKENPTNLREISFENKGQALIVANFLKTLLAPGRLKPTQIAIASGSTAQKNLISKYLRNEVFLDSLKMDKAGVMENNEFEVVIWPLIYTTNWETAGVPEKAALTLHRKPDRTNFILTRAKRQVVLVGSEGFLRLMSENGKELLRVIEEKGRIISPTEMIKPGTKLSYEPYSPRQTSASSSNSNYPKQAYPPSVGRDPRKPKKGHRSEDEDPWDLL